MFNILDLTAIATGKIVKRTISINFVLYPYPKIAASTGANAGTGINCVRNIIGKNMEYMLLF